MTDIIVRNALREDLPFILQLVRELAEYEKEPDAVTATLDDYFQAFDIDLIHCTVAVKNEIIVGMTLSYKFFSTWKGMGLFLEDFYIKPEYRKLGLGQILYNHLLQEAKNLNAKLMKWQVLDWNEPAIKFYEKNHASFDKNWWNCKVLLHD
jgi:ribosomal protein S18 acetylase RimI-like enzyme